MSGIIGNSAVTDGLLISIDPGNPKSVLGTKISSGGGNKLIATSENNIYNDRFISPSSPNAGGHYTTFHSGWYLSNGDIPIGTPITIEYEIVSNTAKDSNGNDIKLGAFMGTHFGPSDMFADATPLNVDISVGKHRYSIIADGDDWTNGIGRVSMYLRVPTTISTGRIHIRNRKIYKTSVLYNMSANREQNVSAISTKPSGPNRSDSSHFFDGVEDFMYADGDGYRYDRTQGHYTEAWFRFPTDASGNWHGLFGRGVGDGGYLMIHSNMSAIYHTAAGGSGYLKYAGGSNDYLRSSHLFADATKWHHIGWRYDPSTENSTIYYNGVAETNHNMTALLDITNWSGGARYIGAGPGRYGKHDMGIYRHYNRALSEEEIKRNFESTRANYGV